mmetsp:Transcript_5623/g.7485  ORF Transcript_5623/g.7485 Transcript_5623/m.7485 type:complete len:158 (+) Transcript_5623:478-951(+)
MCRLATHSSDWIETVPWGWANSAAISRRVCDIAQPILPKHIKLIPCQVIGADHGVSWLQFCSKDCHVVCARRPPYTKPVLELLDKEKNPGNFHLTKEELKGFSSTNIRKAVNSKDYEMLAEGGWVDENVNHHLHSAVSFYMREYEVLSSSLHLCFVR